MAASQGAFGPGTLGTNNAEGAVDWTNPTNAATSDNTYATAQLLDTSEPSYYLVATNYGFTLPTGGRVVGYQFDVEKAGSDNSGSRFCKDFAVYPFVDNDFSGSDQGDHVSAWPTSDTHVTYGGVASLMGVSSITAAQINGTGFGIAISAVLNANGVGTVTAKIDSITCTVFYNPPVSLLPMMGVGIVGMPFILKAQRKIAVRDKKWYTWPIRRRRIWTP